jgi:hypothetical protein
MDPTMKSMLPVLCVCAVTITALLGNPSSAIARSEECGPISFDYNKAVRALGDTIKRYVSCVSESRGRDPCAAEFADLRPLQEDFQAIVSKYKALCE